MNSCRCCSSQAATDRALLGDLLFIATHSHIVYTTLDVCRVHTCGHRAVGVWMFQNSDLRQSLCCLVQDQLDCILGNNLVTVSLYQLCWGFGVAEEAQPSSSPAVNCGLVLRPILHGQVGGPTSGNKVLYMYIVYSLLCCISIFTHQLE